MRVFHNQRNCAVGSSQAYSRKSFGVNQASYAWNITVSYNGAKSSYSVDTVLDIIEYHRFYTSWHAAVDVSGPRFVLIFYDRGVGRMTPSETPRGMTPRVSLYDLLSTMEYRGPLNSTKLLISRSDMIVYSKLSKVKCFLALEPNECHDRLSNSYQGMQNHLFLSLFFFEKSIN